MPQFPNLTNLSFGNIGWSYGGTLILTDLPKLTNLSLGNISQALTLPQFPNLTTASYKGIKEGLILPEQLKNPNPQGSITDSKTVSDTNIKDSLTPSEQLQKPNPQNSVTNSTNLMNFFKFIGFSLILLVFISQLIKNLS